MPDIVEALGRVSSLEELRSAFEIEHPLVTAKVDVVPRVDGKSILIEGDFIAREDSAVVGRFVRVLEAPGDWFRVYHRWINVRDDFSGNKIAWTHYSRAFRYYDGILGVKYVYMDATYDGPYAWGDLGFDFVTRDWKVLMQRLHDIYPAMCDGQPLPFEPATATGLKHLVGPNGERVGWETIRSLHEARGEMRMILLFSYEPTRKFLVEEGILEA